MTPFDTPREGRFVWSLDNNGRCLAFFLSLIIVDQIKLFFAYAVDSPSRYSSIVSYIQIGIYISAFIICFLPVFMSNITVSLGVYAVVSTGVLFGYLLGYADESIINTKVFNILFLYAPLTICFTSVKNFDLVMRVLRKMSIVLVIIPTLTLIARFILGSEYNGRMFASYALVFPFVLLISKYMKTKKRLTLLLLFFEYFILLFFGSRGAVICVTIYIIINIYQNTNIKKFIIYLILAVTVILFFDELIKILQSMNINSRTLQIYISDGYNGLVESRGRTELQDYYFTLIQNKPILGYGITGAWPSMGEYPHNVFIELLMSFGIPIGVLISSLYVFEIVKSIKRSNDSFCELRQIIAINTFSLMFSGTFLTNEFWYVFLALVILSRTPKNESER